MVETEELALGRLGEYIGYRLRLAQLRAFSQFMAGGTGLTPALFSTLLLIEANAGVKQASLAAVLQVDRSTIVRMIDRLAELKLVRRGSSRHDRRVAPPELTARGRAVLDDAVERIHQAEEIVVARLNAKDRRTLLDLLRKLNGIEDVARVKR